MSDDSEIEFADRSGDDRPGLEDADEFDDDFDEDDEFDDLEDAAEDEIDFVVGLYREDGEPQSVELPKDLANDLEELIAELRRYPGDAGTLGLVSINSEMFVLVRVRGRNVQVLLSDSLAVSDYPIARDVADFLGADVDEDDTDGTPLGDAGMLADLGCPEFELEQIAANYDDASDELCQEIADRIKMGKQFAAAID